MVRCASEEFRGEVFLLLEFILDTDGGAVLCCAGDKREVGVSSERERFTFLHGGIWEGERVKAGLVLGGRKCYPIQPSPKPPS